MALPSQWALTSLSGGRMHKLPAELLTKTIKVAVIGAGGTGSQVVTMLTQLDHAMRNTGHPGGLQVEVIDDDVVSESNIGRQNFYPTDVGHPKAAVLVHRINMSMGLKWKASICRLTASDRLDHDLVLGCVDTRKARLAILRAMERGTNGLSYWLDFGNRRDSGQAVLGQVSKAGRKLNPDGKLPHVGELLPEVIDPDYVDPEEGPSCSLAEALTKQSLFINRAVAVHGMSMLAELFRSGGLSHHGVFVNLATGITTSLKVSPEDWARFGYGRTKSHFRVRRKAQPELVH